MNSSVDTQRLRDRDTNREFNRLRGEFVERRITLAEFEEQLEQVRLTPEGAQRADDLTAAPPSRAPPTQGGAPTVPGHT